MSAAGTGPPGGLERRLIDRQPPPASVSVVGARLLNVSTLGIMIESPVPLEPDSILQFRLVVEGMKADVEARVAVCTTGGRRHSFDVGLEFTRMPAEARERLARVLAERPERNS